MALSKLPIHAKLYVRAFVVNYGMGGKATPENIAGDEKFVGFVVQGGKPEIRDGFIHFLVPEGEDKILMPQAINLDCLAAWRVSNE